MRAIHKYPIEIDDIAALKLPAGAQVLCVQLQRGQPCIWALVDTDAPLVTRNFAWRGTGHDVDPCAVGQYVGTIQLQSGELVFHLFEQAST